MPMPMISETERTHVLRAVLQMWDDLHNGMAPPLPDETVRRTVGGHLWAADGRLVPPSRLRAHLLSWLHPRVPPGSSDEFDAFLVSWRLSIRPSRVAVWTAAGAPRRIEPGPHLARATGWGPDRPGTAQPLMVDYFDTADLYPDGGTGVLVDAAVDRMLETAAKWGEPKHSRLGHDMRRWLRDMVGRVGIFDGSATGAEPPATRAVTRLAVTMAVGSAVDQYVGVQLDVASQADQDVRTVAAAISPHWRQPAELQELRRLCLNYDILADQGRTATDEQLGVEFADFRAVFRTFASKARDFRGARDRSPIPAPAAAVRRFGVLLELAIADVRDNSPDIPRRVQDEVTDLVRQCVDSVARQHSTAEVLQLQRELSADFPAAGDRRRDANETLTYLQALLTDLATDNRHGQAILGRSDSPAGWDDVGKLIGRVDGYLLHGRQTPEQILKRLAADMPAAVTALTTGGDAGRLGLDPADARWRLLEGAGDALAKRPDTYHSVVVAGAFAELSWVVANEKLPAPMRRLTDQVKLNLGDVRSHRLRDDMNGVLARIMRSRPLADSKHANFDVAQRAADESVVYGTRALRAAMASPQRSVHRIVAALTGLQLSLLQAGGVFVRSAETELIVPVAQRNPAQRQRHGAYIRDLATTSYTYVNLAVARLHDLRGVVRAGLLPRAELNYPATAAASTAAMGMRTLLLWATLHLAFPDQVDRAVRKLVPSIPAQFRDMLTLDHLMMLNFADMTRIAMHHAFLSGSLAHPAAGATDVHRDTPPHLRPAARLDLRACGEYLVANGVDTGILDVLEVEAVRNVLNESSHGLFDEWRAGYHNQRRRTPTRFRRGDVSHVATRFWDATVGW
jgi:hypothetical protein